MGTWGYGVRQGDFVCDVIGAFEELLKSGKSIEEATRFVKNQFGPEVRNSEDRDSAAKESEPEEANDEPLFWIALAEAQWTFGGLEASVLNRVKDDFDCGRGLEAWSEDQAGLKRRREAIETFICKIGAPNPKPKKPPKMVIRAPKFRPGDCLSVRLENGSLAAALVLAADHSNPEYGKNLIAVLDYLGEEKPGLEVFHQRKWLILSHHGWKNGMDLAWYLPVTFRAMKDRMEVVGQIEILDSDPKESNSYRGWAGIGLEVGLQREWDAKGA